MMHYLADLFHNIKYLAIGGGVTSLAEYVFGYNLFDFAIDKLKKLVGAKAS